MPIRFLRIISLLCSVGIDQALCAPPNGEGAGDVFNPTYLTGSDVPTVMSRVQLYMR